MASIRNNQRRALERLLISEALIVYENLEYSLDGETAIFLLGISRGIGTCSDLHGVNIAVFGFEKPEVVQGSPVFPERCAAAVLLRNATPEERGNKDTVLMVVEELRLASAYWKETDFTRTGRTEIYVNTIC